MSDTALAMALLAGDADARRLAWFRFAPTVRRMVRRFVGRFLDEEDLIQEVFLSFFHRLPSLRDPGALHGFIIAIAVRTGKYHARRGYRRRHLELPDGGELSELRLEAADDLHAQYELRRAHRLLQRIGERDRAAFLLRFVEGMTAKEVAHALGVSLATARRRYSRAQARLKYFAASDVFLTGYVTR